MLTVNLTTTSQRLNLCRITLTSLLMQSRSPDRIHLWVSREPYLRDRGMDDSTEIDRLIETLPEPARTLISVRWVPNTGPYRKLIPVLREAEADDIIVTADDDIFYGRHWLSGLMQAYDGAGGRAVAARARTKRVNFLGRKTSYLYWNLIDQPTVVDDNFIVTFGGGVVLTRSMFREQDIVDDSYLELAPTADDLWYSQLLRHNNNPVVIVPSLMAELNFIEHNEGLMNDNVPRFATFLNKVRIRVWDRVVGFLGFPVCGNDVAYAQIDRYFNQTTVGD